MKFSDMKSTYIDYLAINVGRIINLLRGRNSTLASALLIMLTLVMSSLWPAAAEKAGAKNLIKIVAFGDSLTAGYLLPPDASFPAQLEKSLKTAGYRVEVINAGVSGDTSSGGLARVDWSVPEDADIVILELGANDALRGVNPDETRKNLDNTLQKLTSKGMLVLLTGMQAPQSMGQEYTVKFDSIYPDLSKKYNVDLYPFFLDGVALKPELNLSDGIHPTSEGVSVIVKNIMPFVEKLIARTEKQ